MKNLRFIVSITIIIFLSSQIRAQTVTIDGNAYLEYQTLHDSIIVLFERTAPSSYLDSTYTSGNGQFSINIPAGIYNITYKKTAFIDVLLTGNPLYTNITLTDTTLESIGLYGNLQGTLAPTIYKVGGDITVQSSDTLIISPGVVLKFKESIRFKIHGLLLAEGTSADSIIFTNYDTLKWGGIKFENANSNSKMSYSVIEHSDTSGIRVLNSSPYLHNLVIKNNSYFSTGLGSDGGGGIYFLNSNSILDSSIVNDNKCPFGAGVFCKGGHPTISNTVIKNNRVFYGAGGIYLATYSDLSVINTTIIDNVSYSSYTEADGIYCDEHSNLNFLNGMIAKNIGCGINTGNYVNMRIVNSTILNNLHSGIAFYQHDLFVTNCIIANNGEYGIEHNSAQISTTAHVSYSDISDNSSGSFYHCDPWLGVNVTVNANSDSCDAYNNIQLHPMFADTANGNYHLQTGSPCIDAGINDSVTFFVDLDNNIRIFDGDNDGDTIVDMGAYEYGNFNSGFTVHNETMEDIMTLYPNPSTDYIHVDIENSNKEKINFEIISSGGQILFSKNTDKNFKEQINISNFSNGIYLIKLFFKNKLYLKKIIKF